MTRVLVAGSYPPVPGAASAATLAAVRRALADGNQVEVVSPRPSAAHRTARIKGARAGWVLAQEGRRARTPALVLSIERGMPISPRAGPARRRSQALLLAWGFKAFMHVTLVVADGVMDAATLRVLCRSAHEVVVPDERGRLAMIHDLGLPAEMLRVDGRFWGRRSPAPSPSSGGSQNFPPQAVIRQRAAVLRQAEEAPTGVSPYGPPDWAWYEQPRRFAGVAARRLLGRYAGPVRSAMQRAYRRVRSA